MTSVVRTLHAPVLSPFNVRQTVFYSVGPSQDGRVGLDVQESWAQVQFVVVQTSSETTTSHLLDTERGGGARSPVRAIF